MSLNYFIDGYNVIHSHPRLAAAANSDLERARLGLIDILSEYCGLTKTAVTLFFDGRGNRAERTRPIDGLDNFEVIYSPRGMTADSLIERTVYKIEDRTNTVVVTRDSGIGDLCRGLGAVVISPAMFISEMESAARQIRPALGAKPGPKTLGRLEDRLKEGEASKLDEIKRKLTKQEKEP